MNCLECFCECDGLKFSSRKEEAKGKKLLAVYKLGSEEASLVNIDGVKDFSVYCVICRTLVGNGGLRSGFLSFEGAKEGTM